MLFKTSVDMSAHAAPRAMVYENFMHYMNTKPGMIGHNESEVWTAGCDRARFRGVASMYVYNSGCPAPCLYFAEHLQRLPFMVLNFHPGLGENRCTLNLILDRDASMRMTYACNHEEHETSERFRSFREMSFTFDNDGESLHEICLWSLQTNEKLIVINIIPGGFPHLDHWESEDDLMQRFDDDDTVEIPEYLGRMDVEHIPPEADTELLDSDVHVLWEDVDDTTHDDNAHGYNTHDGNIHEGLETDNRIDDEPTYYDTHNVRGAPGEYAEANRHKEPRDCAICLYPMQGDDPQNPVSVLLCGHRLHTACLGRLRERRCPSCRQLFGHGIPESQFDHSFKTWSRFCVPLP